MDITMCKGLGCPVTAHCHRFTATPSEHQSWFVETPGEFRTVGGTEVFKCLMFWSNSTDAMYNHLKDIVGG